MSQELAQDHKYVMCLPGGDQWTAEEAANTLMHIADDHTCCENTLQSIVAWLTKKQECKWSEDDDGNWETTCGEIHIFLSGTPRMNRHQYCPYCGKKITTQPEFDWQAEAARKAGRDCTAPRRDGETFDQKRDGSRLDWQHRDVFALMAAGRSLGAVPLFGVCQTCGLWEPEKGYRPDMANMGYCPLFDNRTRFNHGKQCTGHSNLHSPNAGVSHE